MHLDSIFRRLRGAAGNALMWGVGWCALGLATFTVLFTAGFLPDSAYWADGLLIAVKLGIIGVVTGGAVSGAIGLLYQGRRLSELSWVRFAIGGGVISGLFVPLFLQTMNILSGGGMVPMELVLDDGVWAAVFGAATAGGMLKLAQRADAVLPGRSGDQHGMLGSGNPLALMVEREPRPRSAAPRSHAED